MGTLLAFAIVGVSILILRYVPPDNGPLVLPIAVPSTVTPHTFPNLFPFDVTSKHDPLDKITVPLLDESPTEQLVDKSTGIHKHFPVSENKTKN